MATKQAKAVKRLVPLPSPKEPETKSQKSSNMTAARQAAIIFDVVLDVVLTP